MAKSKNTDIAKLLRLAKTLAKEYRQLTGKPLGITGEVAEFSAAQILRLQLAPARQDGYDAVRKKKGKEIKIQIKGRCLLPDAKPGQRIGKIRLDKKWDIVILVLMDEDYEAFSIYEASRSAVRKALLAPGSKARNERGALSVAKFKSIGKLVWLKKNGPLKRN